MRVIVIAPQGAAVPWKYNPRVDAMAAASLYVPRLIAQLLEPRPLPVSELFVGLVCLNDPATAS